MVNDYLASGDVAPQILWAHGEGANAYSNPGRWQFYPCSATPTYKIDGLLTRIGWNQSIIEGHIDSRLATPSVINIEVDFSGGPTGGTANYAITAESDPGISDLKVWSAILEDHDIAGSGYGYYDGMELMWEPRAWPCGSTGTSISFTGPYPQTVYLSKPYTLDPSQHTFENLNVVTYVQSSSGDKEVLNAHFIDLPDSGTGTYESANEAVISSSIIGVWPNPSTGAFTISSYVPADGTGSVEIFDITGRSIETHDASSALNLNIAEPGIYFIRLTTTTGETVSTQVAVIR